MTAKISQSTNASIQEEFNSQTEAFSKILLPFVNSASDDKYEGAHLPKVTE